MKKREKERVYGGVEITRHAKSDKYIPTMDEWWDMWSCWIDRIVSSLWREGTKDECLEAAKDAFLKVMGKHPKYKLEDPLEPKTTGQWYKMLYHQTRGMLSNRHKHDDRASGFSTSDEEEIGVFGTEDYDLDAVCRDDFREAIRTTIIRTCREQGFTEKTIEGFLATKLRGLSGREVVASVKGIRNTDALYVRNKSVFDRLKEVGQDRSSDLYALWAA